ncbi:putative PhoH family protein [Bacillus phage vB_BspM_Internexus]|nr:putative PhoH family protein [Bacillus phage vB_BspM_Internexus]
MSNKTFVLDTSVLCHYPESLFSFEDNKIVITETVIEELSKRRKSSDESGKNARDAIRYINELSKQGNITEGIDMDNEGIIVIETNYADIEMPNGWNKNDNDNKMLQVCQYLINQGEDVHFVTKSPLRSLKATILEIQNEDFITDRVEDEYSGRRDILLTEDDLNLFFSEGTIDTLTTEMYDIDGNIIDPSILTKNEYITIMSNTDLNQTGLGYYTNGYIKKLIFGEYNPYQVQPKNAAQRFAIDALMQTPKETPLVILKGPAGTAKTFLSIASALDTVVDRQEYRRILVCRPNVLMEETLGFLPGDENEKIAPLMRPIMDNLEVLIDEQSVINNLFETETIVTQAVGYLRGRSIPNTFIIIDEAQNVTPKAMKGILSRVGYGTKIVICGDTDQIDHPYLTKTVNGLAYASDKMKGSSLCRQITFKTEENQRSPLAQEVTERL